MLGAPSSAGVAGAQAIFVAGLLLLFGYLLADAAVRSRLHPIAVMALAFPALVAWVLLLMLVHIVSGGGVFSEPLVVRSLTGVVFAVVLAVKIWRIRRHPPPNRARWNWWLVGAVVAAATLVSVWPVFRLMPLTVSPDAQLHSGWAMQLLGGHSTPSATVTGDVPNYYPWMFHALCAFVAHLTPGGHVWHALGTIQVLQVVGVAAGLFACGRELTRRMSGGLAAAAFGAFAGGVGFVLLRDVDLATKGRVTGSAGVMEYGGDLLVARPYNITFFNLPPPLPRDVAFALMASFLFALVAACAHKSRIWLVAAGVVAGLIGLTGGESWIVALAIGTVVCVAGMGTERYRALATFAGAAFAVYCVWFVPAFVNYVSFGGFVNTTRQEPVVLPPLGFLGAWGLVTPFAVWGFVRVVSRAVSETRFRAVLGIIGASLAALGLSSLIPIVLGEGFSTLATKHRYWPYVHLGVLLLAAVGFADLAARLGHRSVKTVVAMAVFVVGVGMVSPVVASIAVGDIEVDSRAHRLTSASLLPGSRSVPAVLLNAGPGRCVVAVPPALSRVVFGFTGYRQVLWQGGAKGPNRARIRWRDIYEQIPGDSERMKANKVITKGLGSRERWRELVRKFGVDLVVVEADAASRPVFNRYASRKAAFGREDYVVVEVGECGADESPN